MNVEEQYGFRSSFFFLPQPLPEPVWQDSFYCYNDRVTFDKTRLTIAEIMKKMIDRGWDVGLHGSSMSHASPDLLERERLIVSEACGQEIETVRQHHLFYDIRFTPLYQHRAGFKADSSLGSNVRSCFRCGTGMPFYLYDFIADKELELLEVPLVIQDIALFRNLQMDFETAVNHCFEVMQEVAEIGGAMTLLWHNNYYASSAEYSAYQAILKKASQLGAWGCSVRQMYHWWKNRRSTN
jgi:peptidoglycan/xylan/chitin deacetylase (PgdA/CDA1 family)